MTLPPPGPSLSIVGDEIILNRRAPWYVRLWFKVPLVGPWVRDGWTRRNTRTITGVSRDGNTFTIDRPW